VARLAGKTAVITGASTGLGPVMARMFVGEGARVLLAARREELVREAAAAAGNDAIAMRADVTDEKDVAAMIARAVDAFGHVDVMVNNAAAPGTDTWVWEQTLDNWNATIAIDVTAAMLCTREVLKQSMLDRRAGSIVNFSSTAGFTAMPRKTHYVTAKAALRAFTQAVANEVGPHGIRCNCIVPGGIETELGRTGFAAPPPSRTSTTTPIARACSPGRRCAISRSPRTSPTSPCSSPLTRAGPSPASRSCATPAATCSADPTDIQPASPKVALRP
jgi:NAD(P)-dependent dehydrogenase (short-subunit alcohol dehydrogenase family)